MIESNQRLVFNDHVIDIGRAKEYGCVRVSIKNDRFIVSVHDQFDRVLGKSVYPIERNLTPDELAFMDAYGSNVADAPPEIVEAFLRAESHDEFCEKYGHEYYTPLADAWGVWYDALAYARGSK